MRVRHIIRYMSSSKYFQENSLLPGEHRLSFPTLKWLWLVVVISTMTCIKHIATSELVVQAALLKVFTERTGCLSKCLKR